LNHSVCVIT